MSNKQSYINHGAKFYESNFKDIDLLACKVCKHHDAFILELNGRTSVSCDCGNETFPRHISAQQSADIWNDNNYAEPSYKDA